MKIFGFILLCVLALAAGLSKCALFKKEQVWRYNTIVTVQTPEGLKTGSAVREVTYSGDVRGGGVSTMKLKCKGEAVVVDLGKRGVLFSLMGETGCTDVILRVFHGGTGLRPDLVPAQGKVSLSKDDIRWVSSFVTFPNLNDPDSIKRFTQDEFAEIFGQGVNLSRVEIEMTTLPVTHAIKEVLPWLSFKRLKELRKNYNQKSFDDRVKTYFTIDEFLRGFDDKQ